MYVLEETNDLGVKFDSKITFNSHVEHIGKKCNQMMGFLIIMYKYFQSTKTIKKLCIIILTSVVN